MDSKYIQDIDVQKILSKNFGYKSCEYCNYKANIMNSADAFLYTYITGSAYLNEKIVLFSPKNLMRSFIKYDSLQFVTGIFEDKKPKYTYNYFRAKYPNIFKQNKILINIEFYDEQEFLEKVNILKSRIKLDGLIEENFIVQRIDLSKRGHGMEPFLEYVFCQYMKNKGYLVDNQITLKHAVGSPDVQALKIKALFKILQKYNIKSNVHIIEFGNLKNIIVKDLKFKIEYSDYAICGEVKTSSERFESQLFKYKTSNIYNEYVGIIHRDINKNFFSKFFINRDNEICQVQGINSNNNIEDQEKYFSWYEKLIKSYLISNLSDKQIEKIINEYGLKKKTHKLQQLLILDFETLLKEVLKNVFIEL
jgi:hypothetical protein